MPEKNKLDLPLGVILLGKINFFLFGWAVFILSCYVLINLNQDVLKQANDLLLQEGISFELTMAQVKAALMIQVFLSFLFIVSGFGLVKVKEWGRKYTVYYAFSLVVFTFLTAVIQRTFVAQAVLQIVYPGILIYYFTNKKIEAYFLKTEQEK